MNQLEQFVQTARAYGYLFLVANNLLIIATWWACTEFFGFSISITLAIITFVAVLLPILIIYAVSELFLRPLRLLWQAILYISPNTNEVTAPNIHSIHYAKTFVTHLVSYVYQLADASHHLAEATKQSSNMLDSEFILNNAPIPLVVTDKHATVLFANQAFLQYIEKSSEDVIGNNIYAIFDLSFTSENTLDSWLKTVKKTKITDRTVWERVRLTIPGDQPRHKLLDLAAFYNKDNPSGNECILALFDHTASYSKDDQAISFVALAIHELRTPLTMLRGYIEVFDEELAGKLNPELARYMQNMQASAQQLATFVNNILNVARIEEDQMYLKLQEANWPVLLTKTIQELSLRARVHGITITANIAPNLPTVGLDTVSIYEVMSNLIDNAIKYSGTGKEIVISANLTKDGFVETTVQDFGVGIPETAVPHIFSKFYRDHHNRQEVGGTGMGLYLCHTLITAHGGNVWVRSKEGQGSTFGFTLLPYANLAEEMKNQDNKTITRSAQGWIKNHSLYRR